MDVNEGERERARDTDRRGSSACVLCVCTCVEDRLKATTAVLFVYEVEQKNVVCRPSRLTFHFKILLGTERQSDGERSSREASKEQWVSAGLCHCCEMYADDREEIGVRARARERE